jgi:hypothetical protein
MDRTRQRCREREPSRLKHQESERLHSRKIRSFAEVAFQQPVEFAHRGQGRTLAPLMI